MNNVVELVYSIIITMSQENGDASMLILKPMAWKLPMTIIVKNGRKKQNDRIHNSSRSRNADRSISYGAGSTGTDRDRG